MCLNFFFFSWKWRLIKNKCDRQNPVGICGMPWGISGRGKGKLQVLWREELGGLKGKQKSVYLEQGE